MKKTPFKVLTATAFAALVAVPVAPYVTSAATQAEVETPAAGIYLVGETNKFVSEFDFVFMSDADFNELLSSYGIENLYVVIDGESVNLGSFTLDDVPLTPYKPGDVPAGTYTNIDESQDSPTIEEESTEQEFKVTDISAVTENGITVKLDATPSDAPEAADFIVTVDGGSPITVKNVVDLENGSYLIQLSDKLDGKGVLKVNDFEKDFEFVTLTVTVNGDEAGTVKGETSTSLKNTIDADLVLKVLKYVPGIDFNDEYLEQLKAEVKAEILEATGKTAISEVTITDLQEKSITVELTAGDSNKEFVIAFQ